MADGGVWLRKLGVIIELKAVERLLPIHEAQVLTYLELSGYDVALLINFHVRVLKTGLRRLTLRAPPLAAPVPPFDFSKA